ncbi:MAG TPA: TonB-dependent receptor [Vicinamibacterales bacterium]|nr:TonB-dependent receptor [Vicinamibacterales bacterium]
MPASAVADGGVIAGSVVDPLGAAIAGASVVLVHDGVDVTGSTTDERGGFRFAEVPPGRYQLRVTAAGFDSRTIGAAFVAAGAQATVDVTLPIGPLQQEVVVTASASALPQSQLGAAVTVIDHDTFESLAKVDVLEAVRLVPGLQVVQTGQRGGTTSVFVRGGNANFNKVLIDGVPVDDIGGAFDFATLPTTGVDRVEILRDPNSVLYGTDALSSVISITTRRGTTRTPELGLSVDGGNFGTSRQTASLGGAVGRFDYFSEFAHFDTKNDVPNDAYHNNTFAGRFGWAASSSTAISATVRTTRTSQGVPGAYDYYGIADDSSQTNRDTYVGLVAQSQTTDRWRNTFRLVSSDLNYHFVNPSPTGQPLGGNYVGNPVTIVGGNGTVATGQAILDFGSPPPYPQPFDTSTSRRSAYGQTDYRLSASLDASAGVRLEKETGFTDSGTRTTTDRTNVSSFVEVRASLFDRTYVSGGLGVERNAVFGVAVTPRISVASYARKPSSTAPGLGDTKLTFNFGKGIKEPSIANEQRSLYNLLGALPQGAALISTFGVSPIGPERSRSVDAGVEQGLWSGRGRVRASVFVNHFDDLIESVSKTALPQVGVPAAVAALAPLGASVNSSSFRARGLETSIEVRPVRTLTLIAAYTYLDAVVTQSFASSALRPAINPAYPGIPIGAFAPLVGGQPFRRAPHSGSLLATYAKAKTQLSLAGYFVGRQDASTFLTDTAFGNSLLLPNHNLGSGYQKVDASGAYFLHPRLRVYVSVENVGNERYEAALGYPALPRSVRAGLSVTLGGDSAKRP